MKLTNRSITYILIIVLFIAANSEANKAANIRRSGNLSNSLFLIDKYISEKRWVRIDTAKLNSIQREIRNNSNLIITKNNFYDYLPLMTKETLKIVRNTFFALKGYRFKDKKLLTHFKKFKTPQY